MGETEKTYIEVMAEQWGVPLDLMRVASELWDGIFEGDSVADKGVIARALMAERERCARLIEDGFNRSVGKPLRPGGRPSKNDKCPHDRAMFEDCEQCCADAIRKPVEA